MVARITELDARREELRGELGELLDAAAKDKRALNDEEIGKADALQAELDQVVATRKLEERRLEWNRTDAETADNPGDTEPERKRSNGETLLALGTWLQGVIDLYKNGPTSPKAAASGLNTSVPSEGGVLVRSEFSEALLSRAVEESVLLNKCNRIPIGDEFDSLEAAYIDETSRANGSRWGGVQVFRRAEAETVTAKKPKLGKLDLRLEDIMGLAYLTDRATRDARSLAEIVSKSFASEFAFKIDDEIFRGTGAGQCLGIYPGGALGSSTVQQAKEGGPQTADTVVAANVQKMYAHMPSRLLGGAEWLIGNEVWPQLFGMNQANMPVFMPGVNLASAPFGMLLGRPITPIEQASAIGDLGDITFANLGEYIVIEKDGLQTAESMHVRFLFGENTLRFTYRINGVPAWKAKVTPYKGAFDLSPFIGLEAR
jgi:HK97 family phage major capsid protein